MPRKTYERKCVMCGKTFTTGHKEQILCSKECTYSYNDMSNKQLPVRQTCIICGKEFYKVGKSPFCSNECRQIAVKENEAKELKFQRMDKLDKTLAYCKRMGITYAQYQTLKTLNKLKGDKDVNN